MPAWVFLAEAQRRQQQLHECLSALLTHAPAAVAKEDEAARRIQSHVREKDLRQAVKDPKRKLEAIEIPELSHIITATDLSNFKVQALLDKRDEPLWVNIAPDDTDVESKILQATADELSPVDSERIYMDVKAALELRSLFGKATTTQSMFNAMFADKLVA